MGRETLIAWTDHTFNPWWGCLKVSPGCEHCYAEALAVTRRKLPVWGPASTTERKRTSGPWKDLPKWDAAARRDGVRRRVFVASMADIFEDHPMVAPWRAEALALLEACPHLDVQLLTKRPGNVLAMVPPAWRAAWPSHVWVGTTVEDQRRADERVPLLLQVPAPVRFLSCEPLLEEVGLARWLRSPLAGEDRDGMWCARCGHDADCHWTEPGDDDSCTADECSCGEFRAAPRLQWVIVGGESGGGARPMSLRWARSLRDQCRAAGVPVFIKQMGARALCDDGSLMRWPHPAGADPAEWPADLRVQEFPR